MLSRAGSVGVFQVESRAQMSMLPRLKPKTFYDLVIEVAIVRPGPIQGNMVHPYLRRRGPESRKPFSVSLSLGRTGERTGGGPERTLGVPLFQEQAMQIAIVAAKFTPDEADGLRRAMATFRHNGTVHLFREKFIEGMKVRRGMIVNSPRVVSAKSKGSVNTVFPRATRRAFALLVYASAWIKCHYPEVFCAAILNSQPMGFYQPAQLVRDARQHGVTVREVDVDCSQWECTSKNFPGDEERRFAVRLGFQQIQGLNRKDELSKLTGRAQQRLYQH